MSRKFGGSRPVPTRRPRAKRRPFVKRYSRRPRKPRLEVDAVLAWADAYRARHRVWPIATSGMVAEAPWESWAIVDGALREGLRGFRPGGSLAKFLKLHRGKQPRKGYSRKPWFTIEQILAWADAWHARNGEWPTAHSGRVAPKTSQTWLGVDHALKRGDRGLPGKDSLAQLLLRFRGVRRSTLRPRLTLKQILAWADAHHERTGRWPSRRSGQVEGVAEERWDTIDTALQVGKRGLPTGYTLATLVVKYRGKRYRRGLPPYTSAQILRWADAHYRRHGRWPSLRSGEIPGTHGETWHAVESALSMGRRGMPGGDSLSKFLVRWGRRPFREWCRHPSRQGALTVSRILAWADAFHRRSGRWPTRSTGSIDGVADETWLSVDCALRMGLRGLAGGQSLAVLLEQKRGARHIGHLAPLTEARILAWARAHRRRTGRWPVSASGLIASAGGETWLAVDVALRKGRRGLPGGDSLSRLLDRTARASTRA